MWQASPGDQAGSARTLPLFPTVIRHFEFGDTTFNDKLYEVIKQFQADPNIANALQLRPVATVGGYQPDVVLHQHLADDLMWQGFSRQIVHPAIQSYLSEHCRVAGWPAPPSPYTFGASWAVLYPGGAYQAPHSHGDVFCVLAYYARVPSRPPPEGAITFVNPHPESCYSTVRAWDYHASFRPRAGTALIFPGWLQHYSHPHFSNEERLLLTFDIRLVPPEA